jgi:hypothetical protein
MLNGIINNYSYGMKNTLFVLASIFLMCCQSVDKKEKDENDSLVNEWQDKEILFPKDIAFTRFVTGDTVSYQIPESELKIVTYIGSGGCVKCRLQLPKWKDFFSYTDSLTGGKVPFLFVFYSKNLKDLRLFLKDEHFDFPVFIDGEDQLDKLNHFSSEIDFQTFLLDRNNKIVVAGNPIIDPIVKDLYIKNILGKEQDEMTNQNFTTAEVEQMEYDLGTFYKSERRSGVFKVKNTGDNKLVIFAASTSCGCVEVKFDKHPVNPGESIDIEVGIIPNNIGEFDEKITVKCNTNGKKYVLHLKGNVINE